jgi:hypothetical protein
MFPTPYTFLHVKLGGRYLLQFRNVRKMAALALLAEKSYRSKIPCTLKFNSKLAFILYPKSYLHLSRFKYGREPRQMNKDYEASKVHCSGCVPVWMTGTIFA